MKRRTILVSGVILVIALAVGGYVFAHKQSADTSDSLHTTTVASTQNNQTAPTDHAFNKKEYSLTDPTSIWVVVNKRRPLKPQEYVPTDLVTPSLPLRVPGNESMQMRRATADALTQLFHAASADNTPLMVSSGYRSYAYQVSLYSGYVKSQGQTVADSQSARPGYSEHQTGLAVDVEPKDQQCDVEVCFADLPAGKWVAANAYKYGFIIRYTKDKTLVTGYQYEPWHLRYVGVSLATELHQKNIETLEEFFGLPAAPDY